MAVQMVPGDKATAVVQNAVVVAAAPTSFAFNLSESINYNGEDYLYHPPTCCEARFYDLFTVLFVLAARLWLANTSTPFSVLIRVTVGIPTTDIICFKI